MVVNKEIVWRNFTLSNTIFNTAETGLDFIAIAWRKSKRQNLKNFGFGYTLCKGPLKVSEVY